MVRSILLCALAAATVQDPAPATVPDAMTAQEKLIGTMVSECMRDGPWGFDVGPSEITTPPPGLSRLVPFKMHRLDGPLQAYAYIGFGSPGHEVSCGIAVYGNVPGQLLDDLRAMLSATGAHKVGLHYYQIPGAAPGAQEYWPSVESRWLPRRGVSIIERAPSSLAPTIEVHFHATPVS